MRRSGLSACALARLEERPTVRARSTAAAAERYPLESRILNNLAWLLTNDRDPARRNLKEALALSERSVVLAPRAGQCWSTLGRTRYRGGDWDGAASALETAMRLSVGNKAYDGFLLAMTRWRQGDPELCGNGMIRPLPGSVRTSAVMLLSITFTSKQPSCFDSRSRRCVVRNRRLAEAGGERIS